MRMSDEFRKAREEARENCDGLELEEARRQLLLWQEDYRCHKTDQSKAYCVALTEIIQNSK